MMHGEARQLYREMLEEGYNLNRGLGPVFAIMIAMSIVTTFLFFMVVVHGVGFVSDVLNPWTLW